MVLALIGAFFALHGIGFAWEAVHAALHGRVAGSPKDDALARPAAAE